MGEEVHLRGVRRLLEAAAGIPYYLAWLAEKNAGGTVKVFDEWVKTIAAVGAEDGPGN